MRSNLSNLNFSNLKNVHTSKFLCRGNYNLETEGLGCLFGVSSEELG